MKKYNFDIIVIGAGSAGLTAAIGLSSAGKKVLLVEKDLMGGDCTNFGCIPSKTLIHHAKNFALAKEKAGKNTALKQYKSKTLELVRKQVLEIRKEESPKKLEKNYKNLQVIKGKASFVNEKKIKIEKKDGKKTYKTAKKIIICCGSSPRKIEIPGAKKEDLLTNKTLFNLKEIPENLIIIGAGAISCEMAEAFAKLESNIHVIVRGEEILKNEEPEISKLTQEHLEKSGIKFHFNSEIKKIEKENAVIKNNKNRKIKKIKMGKILLGIGRVPNTKSLNLNKAGLKLDKYGIKVDDHYRTNKKHIFAIGDISSKEKFTHVADDQGRHIVKKILFPFTKTEKKPIPKVIFLEKEVAQTGINFQEALKKYGEKEILKISVPFKKIDRAKTDEAIDGIAILTTKRITGKILGASIVGKNAGEIINVFTVAIQNNISIRRLGNSIYPYPVLSGIIKKLSDKFLRKSLENLKPDLAYKLKKYLPKIFALIFWVTLIATFSRYKSDNNLNNVEFAKNLHSYFTSTAYGPLLYIIFYWFRPLILFPATLLTLISGILFGPIYGSIYTLIGANLTANFTYLAGRFFGKDLIEGDDQSFINRWRKKLTENSFLSVLTMRLIYLPFDLTNYVCGLLKVRIIPFTIATFLGILPGTISFVSFGASIENIEKLSLKNISIDKTQLAISITIFISSIIIATTLKKTKYGAPKSTKTK